MKQTSIRLPDDLHAVLAALAEEERRSLNNQVVYMLRHDPKVTARLPLTNDTPPA